MKYGIISDIHGNLNALEATLFAIQKFKVDKLVCLGDIVGYGPQPNECVQLIQEISDIVLAGNHDHGVVGKLSLERFNRYAKAAIQWTQTTVTDESLDYLSALKLTAAVDDLFFVHASPNEPIEWHYIMNVFDAEESFAALRENICFVGHSHVPVIFTSQNDFFVNILFDYDVSIEQNKRYIINVGSVGQPRDLDARAAFAIYDTQTRTYQLQRIDYDINDTQEKMRKAGLDHFLINRLQFGH